MNFVITEIDAGDEIGRFISFHAVINKIWEVFPFHEIYNFKLELFQVCMTPRRWIPSKRFRK